MKIFFGQSEYGNAIDLIPDLINYNSVINRAIELFNQLGINVLNFGDRELVLLIGLINSINLNPMNLVILYMDILLIQE